MVDKFIRVRGAREHNLKNLSLDIPRDKLVVITGLSGSGKSSLAFDTIYAEGQRRYVESLSAYARQFLEQQAKPDVDAIEGLPPTISIEQRSGSSNPRSTVATTTEIYDYLRLLYARAGRPHCPRCRRPIRQQTVPQMVDNLRALPPTARVLVLAPLVRGRKGEHKDVLEQVRREGFVRVRVDGEVLDAAEDVKLNPRKVHRIEAVVDRLVVGAAATSRLADSLELALRLGEGLAIGSVQSDKDGPWEDRVYSQHHACPDCGIALAELSPRMFSFNSPYGACATCDGLGTRLELDEDLIVPDPTRSLGEGAIEAWRKTGRQMNAYYHYVLRQFARDFDLDLDTAWDRLPDEQRAILMHGTSEDDAERYGVEFEGVVPDLARRFRNTDSEYVKKKILQYMSELPCPDCKGARLKPESLAVLVRGVSIAELTRLSVAQALEFFDGIEDELTAEEAQIAERILKEILARLRFMQNVGLAYLGLDRTAGTLSGGEAQRIRLATQVGSGLVGVCYVLDEPTIGLHQRDNTMLVDTLKSLRDLGNTVLVVEHDALTIRASDWIVDIGPGAGAHGGHVVAACSTRQFYRSTRNSLTADYLTGRREISVPPERRPYHMDHAVRVEGATENNLKDLDASFPLGVFCAVTGVSGSGKSSLVREVLYKALRRQVHGTRDKAGAHRRVVGYERVDKVIEIDQSPIGRTPRSNPATYTGAFGSIRNLFALTKEAKIRGYKPGRFSFNVKGGRCEACEGQGTRKIEMHFLPDIYIPCQECGGSRYNRETLEVRWKGKTIAEVLALTVENALSFFRNVPKLNDIIQTLDDVGMGYMALGQASTTLSGGEAQRVKLASELGKPSTGKTLYILDEPTTGLHFADIHRLLDVLNRLVDLGNTVVVIEHNLDVVKCADYVVDLGPEGGDGGGRLVATGTPEEIVQAPGSHTGHYLRELLKPSKPRRRAARA